MKKVSLIVSALCLGFAASSVTASLIGSDDASNYSGVWTNGSSEGTAFNAWNLHESGTAENAGHMIGAGGEGYGDIGTESFGLYGHGNDTWANADRTFADNGLLNNQLFSIDLAIAYRNGNKGIDLDIGGVTAWTFNADNDLYKAAGIDLGWDYVQDSVFSLSALQVDDTHATITLNRTSASAPVNNASETFSNVDVGGRLDGFGLFVGTTGSDDVGNNLYANNMSIVAVPEPVSAALLGLGIGCIYMLRRKLKK